MSSDIIIVLKLSLLFLLLFAIAELLYHAFKVRAEHTRKIVHIGTGLLTLLFPVYFQHLWQVVVICLAFLLLLSLSMRFHFLQSVNAVSRRTAGSLLYPVIVIGTFAFYLFMSRQQTLFDNTVYFTLPILVMAVCDPVAAISGNWYKKRNGIVEGKTLFGSVLFFIATFILSASLLFYYNSGNQAVFLWLLAGVIALTSTVAEYISKKGWDNFTIPLVIIFILYVSNIIS